MEENSIGKNLLSHRRCIKLMPRRIISQLFRVKHIPTHIRTYHTKSGQSETITNWLFVVPQNE